MLHEFRVRPGLSKAQVLYKNAFVWRLLELQPRPRVSQQVVHFLIIDLKEGAAQEELLVGGLTDGLQDVAETARNYALQLLAFGLAHHGMRLATAGLSVGEDSAVVAFQDVGDQRKGGLAVDQGLLGRFCEDGVIGEALEVVGVIGLGQVDLAVLLVDCQDAATPPLQLGTAERTNTHHHANALAHRTIYRRL
jgi:hypothetical protein